jgi:hypothetical protein
MTHPLPIGVLIPTFNSMRLLPAHLDSVASWLDHVQEVVVVDSHSNDGTFELLQQRLRHPHVRFFSRPRGLYQSWNYGIQQIRSTYAYVSSIGDSISPDGLAHLWEVAERLTCDVVVSPPQFVFDDGHPDSPRLWPVHRIIQMLHLTEPRIFQGMAVFLLALKYQPEAILGNSASDLYRTAFLQQRPFPIEYGTAGDSAWGLLNAFDMRFGITPTVISTFRFHTKSYATSDYAVNNPWEKFFAIATATLCERITRDDRLRGEHERLRLGEILTDLQNIHAYRQRLLECRQRRLPWVLNPSAWRARRLRNQCQLHFNSVLAGVKDSPELFLFQEVKPVAPLDEWPPRW